jgi:hypothetical protein
MCSHLLTNEQIVFLTGGLSNKLNMSPDYRNYKMHHSQLAGVAGISYLWIYMESVTIAG